MKKIMLRGTTNLFDLRRAAVSQTPAPFIPRLYTDWRRHRPEHPGVYAVRDPQPGYAKWDGNLWYGVAFTVAAAQFNTNVSDVQNRLWCGLTEEAYNMMKAEPFFPPHETDNEVSVSMEVILNPVERPMSAETMRDLSKVMNDLTVAAETFGDVKQPMLKVPHFNGPGVW